MHTTPERERERSYVRGTVAAATGSPENVEEALESSAGNVLGEKKSLLHA